MSKKKNQEWLNKKIKSIKEDKKEFFKEFNKYSRESSSKVKDRKKIKDGFKREYKAAKRAERQNWKKELVKQINDLNKLVNGED